MKRVISISFRLNTLKLVLLTFDCEAALVKQVATCVNRIEPLLNCSNSATFSCVQNFISGVLQHLSGIIRRLRCFVE